MQTILEFTELSGLLGLTFSVALLFEWVMLRAIFGAIAAGLRPATVPARIVSERQVRK